MSTTIGRFESVYGRVHDVVVFGGGYAGLAAAVALRRAGRQVLLVERRAALAWESAWGFVPDVGDCADALWNDWMGMLGARNARRGEFVDGAIAEVLASDWVQREGIEVLYYATPIGVWMDGAALSAVAVAAKSGRRMLRARQWVDATETGLGAWIRAGAAAVGLGSKLISSHVIKARAFDDLAATTAQCISWVQAARAG